MQCTFLPPRCTNQQATVVFWRGDLWCKEGSGSFLDPSPEEDQKESSWHIAIFHADNAISKLPLEKRYYRTKPGHACWNREEKNRKMVLKTSTKKRSVPRGKARIHRENEKCKKGRCKPHEKYASWAKKCPYSTVLAYQSWKRHKTSRTILQVFNLSIIGG